MSLSDGGDYLAYMDDGLKSQHKEPLQILNQRRDNLCHDDMDFVGVALASGFLSKGFFNLPRLPNGFLDLVLKRFGNQHVQSVTQPHKETFDEVRCLDHSSEGAFIDTPWILHHPSSTETVPNPTKGNESKPKPKPKPKPQPIDPGYGK